MEDESKTLWGFWSVFPLIRTEYGDLFRKSPCSVEIQELQTRKTPNTDTFYAVQFVDISNKKKDILVQIYHKSSAIFQVNNS